MNGFAICPVLLVKGRKWRSHTQRFKMGSSQQGKKNFHAKKSSPASSPSTVVSCIASRTAYSVIHRMPKTLCRTRS